MSNPTRVDQSSYYAGNVLEEGSEAPGRLEHLRRILNTWWLPARDGLSEDTLDTLAADRSRWQTLLPGIPLPTTERALQDTRRLRDDLRTAIRTSTVDPLRDWCQRTPMVAHLAPEQAGPALRHEPLHATSDAELLAIALDSIADRTWLRLKCCQLCQWSFYDSSRNSSRRWCGMTSTRPGGHSCGSINKMRTYRRRVNRL